MQEYTPEQARKLANISQREMACILGLSENAYIQKEKGIVRFYVDEACEFAKATKIPFEKIIFLNKMCRKNGTH